MTRIGRLLILLGLATTATTASASDLRFSQTAAGNVVATGNTLGLAKQLNLNGPGTEDSIGTFVSLDVAAQDVDAPAGAMPWPMGTTSDWTVNGSDADLTLPARSEVLYAELVWGGSTDYVTEDVTANLDDPVTLTFGADSIMVDPDAATALTIAEMAMAGFPANYYMRTANVTDFVAMHGTGTYSVGGVPATQQYQVNALNAAGWTLVVAYRDSAQPIRNLTVYVGGSFVDENETEDYDFAGFCTPPMGDFEGLAVVSAIEGDADVPGDGLAIAPTTMDMFVPLSGPNNPVTNFFASQINGADGNIDMSGSFGDVNHDAMAGTNVSGARQSWDITHVALSSTDNHFDNGQQAAVLRTQTSGDSFVPTTVAFAIGVNAPDFSGANTVAAADPTTVMLDQTSTVTITMENTGLVTAGMISLTMPLPTGLDLDSFQTDGVDGDINMAAVAAGDLATGVDLGSLAPGEQRAVTAVVRSVAAPVDPPDAYVLEPIWTYAYVSCVGEDALVEPHATPEVVIMFDAPAGTTGDSGSGGTAGGTAGGTGTGGVDESGTASGSASVSVSGSASATATVTDSADGSGGSESGSAGAGSEDGCSCSERGGGKPTAAFVLFALAAIRRRPRARA